MPTIQVLEPPFDNLWMFLFDSVWKLNFCWFFFLGLFPLHSTQKNQQIRCQSTPYRVECPRPKMTDLQSTLQTVVCNLHEKNSAELEWPHAKLEKDVCSLRNDVMMLESQASRPNFIRASRINLPSSSCWCVPWRNVLVGWQRFGCRGLQWIMAPPTHS